jgi:hypothetical protein
MGPVDSNTAPATAILAAGGVADMEEDDDAEAEETPESVFSEASPEPVSEPVEATPAPWSPEPARAPEPEPAATQPALEPAVTPRFQLSGEVTGPPAVEEPEPAASGSPGEKPDSGTPDQ